MLTIKSPRFYISEPGAVDKLSGTIRNVTGGKVHSAYVIWSKTAREKTGEKIKNQLINSGIRYEEEIFSGYPTHKRAGKIAERVKAHDHSIIIAAGGGRTLDQAKAASTLSGVPVITVPTIAATCAAWAAVSILYHDDGDFDECYRNPYSPAAVIADTDIIAAAPAKYLRAGISDTLAKWYEPSYRGSDFVTEILKYGAQEALDFLSVNGGRVADRTEQGIVDSDTVRTVDAIILLAGFVGSYAGADVYNGIAHPYYFVVRRFHDSYARLHGEIVAFGLIVQAVYENRNTEEISEILKELDSVHNVFTLEDQGLEIADADEIAGRIITEFKGEHDKTHEKALRDAIIAADDLVREFRRQKEAA